jgi:hypothetical protein
MTTDDLAECMERLAGVLERAETTLSPEALDDAREITRAVLDVHEAGLRKLLAVVEAQAPEARAALERDAGVLSLLAMHGLSQDALHTRVEHAIASANQALAGQAAASLTATEDERVCVQVEGREHAARELMQRTVERLVAEHAPDALLEITGVGEAWPATVIPVSRLYAANEARAQARKAP